MVMVKIVDGDLEIVGTYMVMVKIVGGDLEILARGRMYG